MRTKRSGRRAGGLALLLTVGLGPPVPAARSHDPPILDPATTHEIVERIAALVDERYVDPEVAASCALRLATRLDAGAYDAVTDPAALAQTLGADLLDVSHDRHLRVSWRSVSSSDNAAAPPAPDMGRRSNYGFRRVERLDGNIGYLEVTGFDDPAQAGPVAAAAMRFLARADAIVIDLRRNGGGKPRMLQLFASYFYGDEPVELSGIAWRDRDEIERSWTLPDEVTSHRPQVPLYVLTGPATFSAGEALAYDMKLGGRAIVVGERTGGGAHPGRVVEVEHGFSVWLPTGRAVSPISGTNWERTGVEPDVVVPADLALAQALVLAMERRLETERDEAVRRELLWALGPRRARLEPVAVGAAEAAALCGTYGPETILIAGGRLCRQRDDGTAQPMTALGDDLFEVAGGPDDRILFIRAADGRTVALRRIARTGGEILHPRSR